jgi:Raf kinase inhibitor-like YbhB/YbcL family protein
MSSLRTDAFRKNGRIPARYTADGENASPPLSWSDLPKGTKELALIVDDPDAPRAEPFVHWVMYKIPPEAGGLSEGVPQQSKPTTPSGAMQGKNSYDHLGYDGPSPPPGHGTHHYQFKLYALDAPLEIQPGLDNAALMAAMTATFSMKSNWWGLTSEPNEELDHESNDSRHHACRRP